ncbi:hypothetical protein BC835DRAFT_1421535 [Cytidiella melzeri]|nr:hypothetical protein BC835DRAFT_1421535 [Cytidiella melzeri]
MSFYTSEFGLYPFGSHKVVFVDELPTQRFDAATLSLQDYEAITVLKKMSQTAVISSTFTKTVLVINYSFRIRCEAAQALVTVVDYPHITEPILRVRDLSLSLSLSLCAITAIFDPHAAQESKAGLAVGKLRSHASKQVADQVKDLVKKWKQTVEQAKLQNGKGSASSGVSKPQVPVCCSFHTYHTQRLDTGDVSPQTVRRDKLKEQWPSARAAFIDIDID